MRLKTDTLNTLILLGAAIGLYWLYKRFPSMESISRAGQEAMALAINPTVSSQFVSAVQFPDGSIVNVGDIVDGGSTIDGQGFFRWGGVQYQIANRDPVTGYYVAKRIVT